MFVGGKLADTDLDSDGLKLLRSEDARTGVLDLRSFAADEFPDTPLERIDAVVCPSPSDDIFSSGDPSPLRSESALRSPTHSLSALQCRLRDAHCQTRGERVSECVFLLLDRVFGHVKN